ncbi:hypothetical protein ACE25A_001926 [Vibrio cholerae]
MTNNIVLDYWHTLQSSRSDWAFRAYDRLLDTLSKEVSDKLKRHNQTVEPYIVIYGKTQVGKTTLLLDLLGVDPLQISKVSKILRGGRKAGESATATAMEYVCSEDDRWGLSKDSITLWFISDDELTAALGELRDDMERAQFFSNSPCIVHIPKHFFSANSKGLNIRILDLPGENPASLAEQNHVSKMAVRYLPFADLVLLVGKGDDLSFLRPEVITIPGIEDWQAMPQHFRIVTTFSYETKTVRDLIRREEFFDTTQIRQRLIQQIELFGQLSEDARDLGLYFPLEFGKSFEELKNKELDLYKKVQPVIKALREELLFQIHKSMSPIGRVRNIWNTHNSIKFIRKKNEDALIEEIKELANREVSVSVEVKVWAERISRLGKSLCKIDKYLQSGILEKIKDLSDHMFISNSPCRSDSRTKEKSSDSLKDLVYLYSHNLESVNINFKAMPDVPRNYWRMIRAVFVEPESDSVRNIINEEFHSIRQKLDGYVIDRYIFSSNYLDDKECVEKAEYKARSRIFLLWRMAFLNALAKLKKNLEDKRERLSAELSISYDEKNRAENKSEILKLEIQRKKEELEISAIDGKEDLERCDRFIQILEEEYQAELSKNMHAALQEKDDCDSLMQMLNCVDLCNHSEELMNLVVKISD